MRHMIKVLAAAALVATILVTSMSPALARVVRGGVLLHTTRPCEVALAAQNAPGTRFELNPRDRAEGCWLFLPPGATQDD
jgi:hypothetical protein